MPNRLAVERREEPRFPAELAGTVTTLGDARMSLPVYIEDVSEGGARVAMAQALECGVFVRLDVVDSTLFGEVRYCKRNGSAYTVGLLLERVLVGPSLLGKLIGSLLEGSMAVEQHLN